jgi:hypothetical protein
MAYACGWFSPAAPAPFPGRRIYMPSLRPGSKVDLFLDGIDVGTVFVRRCHSSWGFGDFKPHGCFARFATAFGTWSLLMHADEESDELSAATADELRKVEETLDQVHAELRIDDRRIDLAQVNIDGPLIEWKEA